MRVLGIDPGLGRTGVAVVEGRVGSLRLDYVSCLETVPQSSDADRLVALSRLLAGLIAEWRPEIAAVERLYFSTNRATAMRVSEARGVILYSLASARIPIAEYTPNEVKEAVAGYGAATKRQVIRMCASLLQVDAIDGPDDSADACAVAICHHHRAGLRVQSRALPRGRMTPALEAAVNAAKARFAAVRPGARS
jgi:crossover junction endodeoxyribonuclease RuvC